MNKNGIAVVGLFLLSAFGAAAFNGRRASVAELSELTIGEVVTDVGVSHLGSSERISLHSLIPDYERRIILATSARCGSCQGELIKASTEFQAGRKVGVAAVVVATDADAALSVQRGLTVRYPVYWIESNRSPGLGSYSFPLVLVLNRTNHLLWSGQGIGSITEAAEWIRTEQEPTESAETSLQEKEK